MNTKKLLSNTITYSFGDVIVVAVSGFLLMPLYTRALSQSEYGIYIITRTNTDILTYLIHFGLISAVSRLYFDYKKKDEHYQYLSSVLIFFIGISLVAGLVIYFCGAVFWTALSPKVQPYPYLWFCFAMVIFGFFSSLSSIWLRIEEKASIFVFIQVTSALFFLALVLYSLVMVHKGLMGLFYALVINSICSAAVLPFLLLKHLVLQIKREHITTSLRYATPIVVGYCAYFALNKGNTVILQHYVPVDQIAVFGLGQQLAMIVTMASNAFAKALQPMFFSAELEHIDSLVDSSAKLYLLLMFCLTNILILFASDILSIVAPAKYSGGYYVFILMLLANFILSASFISDSILLYFKFPSTSVIISVFGGILALGISLLLIPRYHLFGAVISNLVAFSGVLFAGVFATRNLLRHSTLKYMVRFMPITAIIIIFAIWLRYNNPGHVLSVAINLVFSIVLGYLTYSVYKRTVEARV